MHYRYSPIDEEFRLLCFIPKELRFEHIGGYKTIDLILKYFWFPGLRQSVNKYTSHCLICVSKQKEVSPKSTTSTHHLIAKA